MKKTNDGLSGWLSPDGEFYSASSLTHSRVAIQIIESSLEKRQRRIAISGEQGTIIAHDSSLRMMDWIVMGCNEHYDSDMDYIFFPTHRRDWNCTEAQKIWLESKKDKMRPNQLKSYMQQLEMESW